MPTNDRFAVKQAGFRDIRDRRRDEEDRDIDPVGRFSDGAVIGVKQDGDQGESEEDAAKLDAPKVRAVSEEKAFDDGKKERRPKEKLHMLPGRFVNSGKRRDPNSPGKPLVKKMKQRSEK